MTPGDKEEIEEIVSAIMAANKPPTPWKDWRFLVGIPAMLVATTVLWNSLGLPIIATDRDITKISEQVKKGDRDTAELSIQVYQNAINALIANTPPPNAPAQQQRAWQQQYDQFNKALDRAIANKVELGR